MRQLHEDKAEPALAGYLGNSEACTFVGISVAESGCEAGAKMHGMP